MVSACSAGPCERGGKDGRKSIWLHAILRVSARLRLGAQSKDCLSEESNKMAFVKLSHWLGAAWRSVTLAWALWLIWRCGRAEDTTAHGRQSTTANSLKEGWEPCTSGCHPLLLGHNTVLISFYFSDSFNISFAGSSSSIQLLKVGIPQAGPSFLTVYFFPGPFQLCL